MDDHYIEWDKKISKAYFRGYMTGSRKDNNGNYLGRYKLMWDSLKYPD